MQSNLETKTIVQSDPASETVVQSNLASETVVQSNHAATDPDSTAQFVQYKMQ